MGARESKVERYLDTEIKKLGGMTEKWENSFITGNPDRIVFLQGLVFFVEVKTLTGMLSKSQQRYHDKLRKYGCKVFTVYGHKGVNKLISKLKKLNELVLC